MPTFTTTTTAWDEATRKYVKKPAKVEYATEEELLEFANKVRKAGGANALDALMPSDVGIPESCLIANALNFDCRVEGVEDCQDGSHLWGMFPDVPDGLVWELARKLAEETGCRLTPAEDGIILPARIGNAADAFDNASRGWVTKYRNEDEDDD